MRLFTAIEPSPDTLANLKILLDSLRPAAPLRWSPPANLHVTTKFIGDWPESRLAELTAALSAISLPAPFPLAIRGLAWFPNPHQPRVLFAGVHAGPPLHQLAGATAAVLAPFGIPADERAYNPHLTLARIPPGAPPSAAAAVRQAIARLETDEFGDFQATHFRLYHSIPVQGSTGGGSLYTPLASFPFPL